MCSTSDSYSSPPRKAQAKRRRKPTIYTWIKDRISLDIGQKRARKDGSIGPIHLNPNEDVLRIFNNGEWWRLDRLTKAMLDAHFSGDITLYFTSTGSPKIDEILVLIDIDCHHWGTLAGAIAFAKFLRQHYFPGLYFETSTNGNGVHAYLRIHKSTTGDAALKGLLARLDGHLKSILADTNFDVELVEIKGQCPVFTWDKTIKGKLTNYTSGTLAKLPRCKDRFDELQNTTLLTTGDLLKLPVPSKTKKPRPVKSSAEKHLVVHSGGSSSPHTQIEDAELAEVHGHYSRVAAALMGTHCMATSGGSQVVVEDMAIFLMLLKAFTLNMYSDGSMPWKRFYETWNELKRDDKIGRAFDEKRFKAIRDFLSSLGLIDWQDKNYVIGWTDDDGVYHKGKAAKWKASESLMAQLELPQGRDEGDEREHITGSTMIDFAASLVRQPDSETIRPQERRVIPIWRSDPDWITSFVTSFDHNLAA